MNKPDPGVSLTRYERSRKLIKWACFSALLTAATLVLGDGWPPPYGGTFFSSMGVVMAATGEILFDRRNEKNRHDGRSDYTTIFGIVVCISLALYAMYRCGEVKGNQTADHVASAQALTFFVVSICVGAATTYYSAAKQQ